MPALQRSISFVDSEGRNWIVVERPGTPPTLVFTSTDIVRRVATIPPEWHLLTPPELEALSWQR